MGWYDKGLHIDPNLVSMTGGVGKGLAAFGNSLVSLGDQKIKKAKEDAALKKEAANKRSVARGLNVKNRVLNPDAVNKLAKSYGIDKNSPLYKLGAPSQFNTDLGLADFGKAAKKQSPTALTSYIGPKGYKHTTMSNGDTIDSKFPVQTNTKTPTVVMSYIGADNYKYTRMSDNSVIKSKYPVKQKTKTPTAPKRTSYWDPEKQANMVKEWNGKSWVKTGEYASKYNQSAKESQTKGLKNTGGLSSSQMMYARDNHLTKKVNGKEYVPTEVYNKLVTMDKIGNIEVK